MRYIKSRCRYNGVRLFIKNKNNLYLILSFQGFVKDVDILLELQIFYSTLEHGGSKLPETSLPYYPSTQQYIPGDRNLKEIHLITEHNKIVSFL
jgi:hypothetical protein